MFERTTSSITLIGALLFMAVFVSSCGDNAAPPTDTSAPGTSASGAYKINLRIDPNPPAGAKENTMHVTVEDSAGKPVSDAQVHITLTMPAMPEMKMPEMKNGADLPWTGSEYSAPVQVTMAGGWNVEVEAKRGNEVLGKYETRIDAK
jgi:hypothetical protein